MKTQNCPTCHGSGHVPPGYKAESATVRSSLFTINQAEKPPEAMGAVHIPRAHARDFCGTASVLAIGASGLMGATPTQCAYAGIMTGAVVFGIVRAMGTFQDNKRVDRRDELAVTMIPQAAPSPSPTPPTNDGYLPVHSAPPLDRHTALKDFVQGCETNTAQNYWEGTTRRMERDKYYELRDLLIRLGWASWKNPNARGQGWKLLFSANQIITGLFRGTTQDGSYAAPPPH